MPSSDSRPGPRTLEQRLAGCLLGLAIGDALGLPCEGLSPGRQRRMFSDLDGYALLGPYGLLSDDTEHACMTAAALLAHPAEVDGFTRSLAWKLRWWLLGLPAGVGLATLRAIVKLWLGWNPQRSGVFSAGNGPAMRAPLLGVALGHAPEHMCRYLRASTLITHRDPRALAGALAVALAAWQTSQGQDQPEAYLAALKALCPDQPEFMDLIEATLARLDQPLEDVMGWLGCERGISGFMLHTVPAVLWLRFRHGDDFGLALRTAIRCGGDTDTVAAILGGILGADGRELPPDLLRNLRDWPRSVAWMRELTRRLAVGLSKATAGPAPFLNPIALLLRNLLFMLIVLGHGFRRLLPPY